MIVLHLIDPGGPGGGPCTLKALAEAARRIGSVRPRVLVIGSAADERLARRCGVEVAGALRPPLRVAALGLRALRAYLRATDQGPGRAAIVHAWTPSTTRLALRAVGPERLLRHQHTFL